MPVNQLLGALGSWEITLADETPVNVLNQIGFLGHVAIVNGRVDVEATGDSLLTAARYVGVCRGKPENGLGLNGSGMAFWLGDEDDKGRVLETELNLTGLTLTAAVNAILAVCPTVTAGTINSAAGTLPATRLQFMSPRRALQIVVDSFGVEFRVNGNATVDVGTAAQLYNTTAPDSVIVRKGAGVDMDLVALGGDYTVESSVYDYSTRVVLLGQTVSSGTDPTQVFAVGSATAGTVPYKDLFGNTVQITRMISESGETSGSVAARAQLQLNRFNRVATSLKVTAENFETEGNFVVGDNAYVYDPDTGIVNAANEIIFRGEVLHPDVVRIAGITWPVTEGHTVAFRTGTGTWVDLTPFVTWETGTNEVTVGDLPKSLTTPTNTIQDRVDAGRGDASTPNAPTALTLTTNAALNSKGQTVAAINASWTAPTLNTDGTTVTDLSHYRVQYRPQFRSPLWEEAPVTGSTSTVLTVPPSLAYDVRVAAVDLAGHVSAFTATSSITAASDSSAPNAPADPVVTNYLGQLRIEYAGTDSTGNPMASDTNRIDVHVGTTVGFTATTATRVASINPFAKGVAYATAPYGSTRYVRLIAIDHDGNVSASSAVVSGSTSQVVSADVFDGAIGSAKLADLAVTTAKINDLAVNNAKIGDVSVGKLTAGTMTADVVTSGRFTTALTGARREMNSVGFQAYNSSGTLLVNLDGANNLLTGIFKTALTGRRIEMGASGLLGEIHFLAPDGSDSFLRAYTQSSGIEAIQLGVDIGLGGTLWNRINYNNDEWSNYRAAKHDFYFTETGGFFIVRSTSNRGTSTVARFQVDDGGVAIWDGNTNQRVSVASGSSTSFWDTSGDLRFTMNTGGNTLQFDTAKFVIGGDNFEFRPFYSDADEDGWIEIKRTQPGSGSTTSSAQLAFVSPLNQGAVIKFNNPPTTALRLEIRNINDSGYEHLWAASFDVSSDRSGKEQIRDLGPGSLAMVRALRPRRWVGAQDPQQREMVGLVTDEAPADLVTGVPGDSAINLYALATRTAAAVAELADIVDQMRRPA